MSTGPTDSMDSSKPTENYCKVLEILENKDKDPYNIAILRIIHALKNLNFMVTSYIDNSAKEIAYHEANKFLKATHERSNDITRQYLIIWIKTYLKNSTKIPDSGYYFDKFINTYC